MLWRMLRDAVVLGAGPGTFCCVWSFSRCLSLEVGEAHLVPAWAHCLAPTTPCAKHGSSPAGATVLQVYNLGQTWSWGNGISGL